MGRCHGHNGKHEKSGKNARVKAVAYLRTSSAANVGQDKDSEKRQRHAIAAYAKAAKFEIATDDRYYDPAVSGADPIETRPGFNKLLDRIEGNGVRVVIIEDASRVARDLMTQELGILSLIKLGVHVITATGDDLTDTTDPMKKAMRQIAGAFAELEKAQLVAKLRGARERKRERRNIPQHPSSALLIGEGGSRRALTHRDTKGRRLLWPEI